MKKKILHALLFTVIITSGFTIKAYADVDGYVVKSNDTVYQYSRDELTKSFLNSYKGEDDTLYKDFKNNLEKNNIYLFHDSEGKYVKYDEIKASFMQKTINKENFDLDSEIKEANKAAVPSLIENIKVENKAIVKELVIAKEGMEFDGAKLLKDKYKKIYIKANKVSLLNVDVEGDIVVDPGVSGEAKLKNIKCRNIDVLSGKEKGISFDNVKSNNAKVKDGLKVKIQYKDKESVSGTTPSGSTSGDSNSSKDKDNDKAKKEQMLKNVQSGLNGAMDEIHNDKEKKIVKKISNCISSIINDENYNYKQEVQEVKEMFINLSDKEKQEFTQIIVSNVRLSDMFELGDLFGIDVRMYYNIYEKLTK